MTDKQLIERIRTNDKAAFDSLFRKWYPVLLAYARNYVDNEDARNLVQDLMVHIWENASKLNIGENVGAYLHIATRNRCLDHISRENTHKKMLSSLRMALIETNIDLQPYSAKEIYEKFEKALALLPMEQRAAYELSRFEKRTYKEIAEITDVAVKTVQYRVKAATQKLVDLLGDILPIVTYFILNQHN